MYGIKPAMAAKQCAGSSSSLAAELLHKISPMPYKTYAAKINECDAVTPDNFKNSRWANYFTVDSSNIVKNGRASSNIVKNGRANPNHVFDIFGLFSGHTGTEVRVKLLENIASEMTFYERRSAVYLQMRLINFETWVETITDEHVYCDELALMGLCYMYHRHCVVLTQNKLWSTVQADTPLNLLDLLNICSVHLIYLGNLCFGVLTWRPQLPKKVATKSPEFNIIEEYTLDEANAAVGTKKCDNKSAEEVSHAGNVETNTVVHTDCPESGNTTINSSAAQDKIVAPKKADSTDVGNYVSNITSTGELETSATEHCSAQETSIPVERSKHADSVKPHTEHSASVLPDNQPNSALHVVNKTDGTSLPKLGLNESTENVSNSVGQCIPKQNNSNLS